MKDIKREKGIQALEEFLGCCHKTAVKYYEELEKLRYSED